MAGALRILYGEDHLNSKVEGDNQEHTVFMLRMDLVSRRHLSLS